jgi:hypothetical protein
VQEALHERHVEPSVELASGLVLHADEAEPAPTVQGSRCFAPGFDPSKDGVEPAGLGDVEQMLEEQAADARAGAIAADLD